jgi:SAM-dependent methyltransferase
MDEQSTAGLNEQTKRSLGQSMSLGGDPSKLADYYNDWATTYDRDVGETDEQYGLPGSVLIALDAAAEQIPALRDPAITVLDAGCGTGRVAIALASAGYSCIDGVDLSSEMVALAERRTRPDGSPLYRRLESGVDLTTPPTAEWVAHAELVVVGGVFTIGHIPPIAIHQVAKLVKPGGVLITTVRPGYYDTTDYADVSAAFAASPAADLLVEFESLPYTEDSDGRYFVYRIN